MVRMSRKGDKNLTYQLGSNLGINQYKKHSAAAPIMKTSNARYLSI